MFASKSETMLSDFQRSREAQDAFESLRVENSTVLDAMDPEDSWGHYVKTWEFQFVPTLLTCGSWPVSAPVLCTLPSPLYLPCRAFEQYYASVHVGRKLTWHTGYGFADVQCNATATPYILDVTTFQACILLMFNEVDEARFW